MLLLNHLLLFSWLHFFTELWHNVILVSIVISELNVVVYFWGGDSIIDTGIHIEVSVLWDQASGNNVVISDVNWVALLKLGLSLCWSLLSLFLGLISVKGFLLLGHESLVVLRVDSTKLDGHTVVKLSLVDGAHMGNGNFHSGWLIRLGVKNLLGLLLLVVPVLRVDIMGITKLDSHTVVELTLVDGANVSSWVP